MYQKLAVLSADKHRNRRFRRPADFFHARSANLVEIVADEISPALRSLPLCFSLLGETPILAALFSPIPGRNLYVTPAGGWVGAYQPTQIRLWPFAVHQHEGTALLCIDEVALTDDDSDVLLFDVDGQISEELLQVQKVLSEFEQRKAVTRKAVAELQAAGLLSPWPLKLEMDGAVREVKGLLHVEEERLKNLAPETLSTLAQSSALGLAYAQLISQSRMQDLQQAASAHAKADESKQALEAEMSGLFGGKDDLLKFDF